MPSLEQIKARIAEFNRLKNMIWCFLKCLEQKFECKYRKGKCMEENKYKILIRVRSREPPQGSLF